MTEISSDQLITPTQLTSATPPSTDLSLPTKDLQTSRTRRTVLALMVVILFLVFASRIIRLPTMNLEKDEAWSAWITLGSFSQTMDWVGYDWPPGSFVVLYIWRVLTGIHPFALRALTVYAMVICVALLYLLARKIAGRRAGILAALAFGGFGYTVFISTLIRGYIFTVSLFVLAMILAIRYFEQARDRAENTSPAKRAPSRWLAVLIGLTLTAMFYIHITAALAMGMIVLYTLIVYRPDPPGLLEWGRWIRRWFTLWIIPGVITAVLCIPELLSKLYVIGIKQRIVTLYIPYSPPADRLINHYLDYAGQQPALWVTFVLIAGALLVDNFGMMFRNKLATIRLRRRTIALIAWMLMPIALIWITVNIDAFQARHLAWVMVGFAIWIGWGLSLLPRPAVGVTALIMAFTMFDKVPVNERYEAIPRVPMVTAFEALKKEFRNGDVILRDIHCKTCTTADPEEWDYMTRAYFPYGLTFITADQLNPPQAHPRVWHVSVKGEENPAILKTLDDTRAMSRTLGEDAFYFRLYEAAPDPVGIRFENGMHLLGVELLNDARLSFAWKEGDTVFVRLWWSTETIQTADYSEGTYLWKPEQGGVLAQTDSPPSPLFGDSATSKWIPGKIYLEERALKLPYPLEAGDYAVMLSLYQWWDGKRLNAPGVNSDGLLPLGTIFVKSF